MIREEFTDIVSACQGRKYDVSTIEIGQYRVCEHFCTTAYR